MYDSETGEPVGPAWEPRHKQTPDKYKAPSLEGFYFWFMKHGDKTHKRYFKYLLARLARVFPEEDPREFIVEFFVEAIVDYEKSLRQRKKRLEHGTTKFEVAEKVEKRTRTVLERGIEAAERKRIEAEERESKRKTTERDTGRRMARSGVPWFPLSGKRWDSS